jgi:hypothetical protein
MEGASDMDGTKVGSDDKRVEGFPEVAAEGFTLGKCECSFEGCPEGVDDGA